MSAENVQQEKKCVGTIFVFWLVVKVNRILFNILVGSSAGYCYESYSILAADGGGYSHIFPTQGRSAR